MIHPGTVSIIVWIEVKHNFSHHSAQWCRNCEGRLDEGTKGMNIFLRQQNNLLKERWADLGRPVSADQSAMSHGLIKRCPNIAPGTGLCAWVLDFETKYPEYLFKEFFWESIRSGWLRVVDGAEDDCLIVRLC